MEKIPQISEAEYEVMRIVRKYTPINTNEVTDKLTKTTEWSPKTIHTLLKRLVNKGALTYEKDGRIFVYTPLVQEDEYINQQSTSFLNRFFSGNVTSMLSSFLDHDQLSQSEIDELRSLLDEKSQKEE